MPGYSPIRTCVGCGQRDIKNAMRRFTVGRNGLELNRIEGRGGYLHDQENCWRAFLRRKSLYRTFRRDMSLEDREALLRKLRHRWSEK